MSRSLRESSLLNTVDYRSLSVGVEPSIEYLISTTVVGATPVASVEFDVSAYAGVYRHLKIVATPRTDRTGVNGIINIAFNSDTTAANYRNHELFGDSSNVYSIDYSGYNNIRVAFRGGASGSAANFYGGGVLDILDPFTTSKNTTIRSLSGDQNIVALNSGAYFQTAAITSIKFTPESASNILTGSRFSIYGVTA